MMKNCKNELLIANLIILLADVHIDSGYLVVVTKVFQMYGAEPVPSLYTKYYRAW